MYHFTYGYTHRLHTRMQAIVRTYNIPVHTRMCIMMSYIHTYVGHIIAHTPNSVYSEHWQSGQIHCGITGMLNYYSMKAKTITMVNILLIVNTLIHYIELHTHSFTY